MFQQEQQTMFWTDLGCLQPQPSTQRELNTYPGPKRLKPAFHRTGCISPFLDPKSYLTSRPTSHQHLHIVGPDVNVTKNPGYENIK